MFLSILILFVHSITKNQRELAKVYEKTHSVWDFVRANAKYFTNAEYVPKNEPLFPAVEMWR